MILELLATTGTGNWLWGTDVSWLCVECGTGSSGAGTGELMYWLANVKRKVVG